MWNSRLGIEILDCDWGLGLSLKSNLDWGLGVWIEIEDQGFDLGLKIGFGD